MPKKSKTRKSRTASHKHRVHHKKDQSTSLVIGLLLFIIAAFAVWGFWSNSQSSIEEGELPEQNVVIPAAPTKYIVFASQRNNSAYEIYRMNPNGSGVTNLTNNPSYDDQPAVSPDGAKIAFASNRGGDSEIFIMNINGTGLTQLTSNTIEDASPSFSQDGSQIVFSSGTTGIPGSGEVWKMNANGRERCS